MLSLGIFMGNMQLSNENRIEIAETISAQIKQKFGLTVFELSLNTFNENINIKLLQSEATQELLTAVSESLSINYRNRYIFKSAPILSGSYMDNPMQKKTAIYYFEKI